MNLTWDELIALTPAEFYRRQVADSRKEEKLWYPVREVVAMVHNTASKRSIKGKDVIELSRDRKEKEVEWDDDLVRKILHKWN